jgi:putative Mg2+ transporter-C (MgtC) family protein
MYDGDLNIVVRLIIAVVLSGVLGWERESARKSAGLRTHILVGFSAALFVVLGEFMAADFRRFGEHVRFDGANLIGAVVTGISFLGAGMIIFQRRSHDIKGLTTAAGILATAAIGMLVGMQRYFLAAAGTAIVFVVLHIVHYFEPKQKIAGSGEGSENDAEDDA